MLFFDFPVANVRKYTFLCLSKRIITRTFRQKPMFFWEKRPIRGLLEA